MGHQFVLEECIEIEKGTIRLANGPCPDGGIERSRTPRRGTGLS